MAVEQQPEEAAAPPAPASAPAPAPSGAPSLSARLAAVQVELRPELEVSRHHFRREVSYILRDPITFQSHRFSAADYRVLTSLKSYRTLAEAFEQLVEQGHLQRDAEERFYQFVFSMHKIGFLKLPISDDATLYKRHQAKQAAKRSQAYRAVLSYQVPLFNPDAFLERTMRYVRPVFTTPAYAAWVLLVSVAGLLIAKHWEEFSAPVMSIFQSDNLPILWATLVLLKVAHEFGHAYACKNFGGHVPEMGMIFIMFTPCAFVDATASWGFSKRSQRLFVCLAGMYVELAIAALATLLWAVTPPGTLRSVLHNIIVLASIVTIGFNINPLMRYDGYYALSDILEIPNLRARSSAYALDFSRRVALGLKSQRDWGSLKLRFFLLSFGLSSAVYKATLILGISTVIATKFLAAGLFLGSAYFANEIYRILRRSLPYLWYSQEASSVRSRAVALSLLGLVLLPAGIMAVPLPGHVRTTGLVAHERETTVRAEAHGFLDQLLVQPGDLVESGAELARLGDPEARATLNGVEAERDAAFIKQQVFASIAPAQEARERLHLEQLEQELRFRQERLAKLAVLAPAGGRVAAAMDESEQGQYVAQGAAIATIVSGPRTVRALLTEEDIADTRPAVGQDVEFRALAMPERVFHGTFARVTPAGSRKLNPIFHEHLDLSQFALNPVTGQSARNLFEVEILLDADVPAAIARGMTGILRMDARPEPIGRKILRKVVLFVDRLAN